MKMNKTGLKAIIFDLDGTLLDSDELIIKAYEKVFDTFRPGYKLTEEEKTSFLGPTLATMFSKYFTEDFETLLKVYEDYAFANKKVYGKLYPNVIEMLNFFKSRGFKLGLVTSRFMRSAEVMLEAFDLTKYFDKIVTLDIVKNPKPDPEGINLVLKEFNVLPDEAIYIGDNKSDFIAARDAHVHTALVTWAKNRDNSILKPEILINSFEDFMKSFS